MRIIDTRRSRLRLGGASIKMRLTDSGPVRSRSGACRYVMPPTVSHELGSPGRYLSLRVQWKVEPRPGFESTLIVLPMASASCWHKKSPRPEPPYLRVVDASIWLNILNNRGSRSAGIPTPVSETENSTSMRPDCSKDATTLHLTTTWPVSVNLTAFDIQLRRICLMRQLSPSYPIESINQTNQSNRIESINQTNQSI